MKTVEQAANAYQRENEKVKDYSAEKEKKAFKKYLEAIEREKTVSRKREVK